MKDDDKPPIIDAEFEVIDDPRPKLLPGKKRKRRLRWKDTDWFWWGACSLMFAIYLVTYLATR